MSNQNPDWIMDNECPECGEDTHLQGFILKSKLVHSEEETRSVPLKAELMCGIGPVNGEITGCGHEWDWVNEEEQ